MDQQANPYASPHAVTEPASPQSLGGVWRDGQLLVMHKGASLPDICVKSNEPAEGFKLRRKMHWHPKLLILLLLVGGPLLYLIVATLMSKRANVMIGLSEKWRKIRIRRMLVAWGLGILCLALFIVGCTLDGRVGQNADLSIFLVLGGMLGALFVAIFGILSCRLIAPHKIDDNYVYIKNVHPEFLDRFPAVPMQ